MAATKIAIVGAGLGGLAAALFLRRAELNVVVYEQSTALHEIGAGIVVPPNMVRLLRRLDLAKKLDEFAVDLNSPGNTDAGKTAGCCQRRRWARGVSSCTAPLAMSRTERT